MTCGEGSISKILFAVPNGTNSWSGGLIWRHIRCISGILDTGLTRKHVYLIVGKSILDPSQHLPQGCLHTVIRADLPPYAVWTQDPILVVPSVHRNAKRILLSSSLRHQTPWLEALERMADVCEIPASVANFTFAAGNILQGDKKSLVGFDSIQRIAVEKSISFAAAQRMMEQALGAEVVVVGGYDIEPIIPELSGYGYQPFFHLDQFITRTGVLDCDGREVVFLADPSTAYQTQLFKKDRVRRVCDPYAISACEEQLSQHFNVRRIPALVMYGNLTSNKAITPYLLSSNNCIVDFSSKGRPKVVLPSYHNDSFLYGTDSSVREALQNAAATAWRKLGADVHFCDGVEDLAFSSGGIHCFSKVLERTPPSHYRTSFNAEALVGEDPNLPTSTQ